MFGKRKEGKEETKGKLSPKEILAQQIEQQLTPGQALRFKTKEKRNEAGFVEQKSSFIIIEQNAQYPQAGKKYICSLESIINDMPSGNKSILYETDKLIDCAGSILDRKGELFVAAK